MSLAKALLEVQKELPAIEPDAVNPHFKNKYVSLDRLLAVCLPILNKHGIVLHQFPVALENSSPGLKTQLVHAESDDSVIATMPLLLEKENSQGLGSAITYGRRYMLAAMLGVSSEKDDDGNAASTEPARKPVKQEVVTPAKPEKLRERLVELAAEADSIRDPAVEAETTWNELVRFAVEVRETTLSDMDSVQLTLLGTELREYVDRHAKTGMTFFDYANTPF